MLFEKHAELDGSIAGGVNRDGLKTLAAGDVDNGVFSLEESDNGQAITATWHGAVVAGSCGKEISGTWNNAIPQHLLPIRPAQAARLALAQALPPRRCLSRTGCQRPGSRANQRQQLAAMRRIDR